MLNSLQYIKQNIHDVCWFKDDFSLFLGILMYVYDNDMEQTEIKFQTRIKLLLDFDMVMIIKVKLTLLSQMV